jgi:hypothetical protein
LISLTAPSKVGWAGGAKTYPGATDCDVQDKVHGTMGEGTPHRMVAAELTSSDGVICNTIKIPRDSLLLPVGSAGGVVPDDAPRVPVIVRDSNVAAETRGLVAETTRRRVAVRRAVSCEVAVNHLHDVELAACRPATALSQRLA